MPKSIYKRKGNFKGILFVFGLLIIAGALIYTQYLVNTLQQNSREYLNFKIRIFEANINNPDTNSEIGFFFDELIRDTDYPIIYTDTLMVPISWRNISEEIDSISTLTPEIYDILKNPLQEMDSENSPIPIQYQGMIFGYYHYGVSPVIKRLQWLPYLEIGAAILFILLGYLGFSQIKKSEERYIWVGMAKETAHQLGTPLSSIIGWLEIITDNPKKFPQAQTEIEADVKRLSKVASRFSQIGSIPSLKETNVTTILKSVVDYFKKRLPQLGEKIIINENYSCHPVINLNADLFEWVIENLLKNAIDSIERQDGLISIVLIQTQGNGDICIDITDNGKGINSKDKKNIFKPGFSTKSRGWGLGLSLAKRIIEDYHGGKLFVKETQLGIGTTITIILKSSKL